MAKIEHGVGALLTIDTEKKTLRFKELRRVSFSGQPPAKEWELPYSLDWDDKEFYTRVGTRIEYVTSDGIVVAIQEK